jgi:hypothetical protein
MDTICSRQTQSSQKVIHSLRAGLEQTTRESSDLEPRELSRGLGLFDSIMVVVGAMSWFGYLHCSGGDGPSDWKSWLAARGLGRGRHSHDRRSAVPLRALGNDAAGRRYACLSSSFSFAKLNPLCGAFSMAGHSSLSSRPGRSPRWRWPLHDFLVYCGR